MTARGYYAQRFSVALAMERPELAKFLISLPRGESDWIEVLEVPRPGHKEQSLLVVDRGDAMEIAWRGLPTRGPAEFYWIEAQGEDERLVLSVVKAVISILEGNTSAVIRRYRILWFKQVQKAQFRQQGELLPRTDVVEEVYWK